MPDVRQAAHGRVFAPTYTLGGAPRQAHGLLLSGQRCIRGASMKVVIVGTGYVGLVTGACLAEAGNQVVCVDSNEDKIRCLRAGRIPFYEPDLEDLVSPLPAAGRLTFTTCLAEAC